MQVTVEQVESPSRSLLDAELRAVAYLFLRIFVGSLVDEKKELLAGKTLIRRSHQKISSKDLKKKRFGVGIAQQGESLSLSDLECCLQF